MSTPSTRRFPWIAVLLACATISSVQAQAQMATYQSATLGFAIAYPTDWFGIEESDGAGVVLTYQAPGDGGLALVLAQPVSAEDEAHFHQTPRTTLGAELWEGFSGQVPGSQMVNTFDLPIAGTQAIAIDFVGPGMLGSIYFFVENAILYTLGYIAEDAAAQAVQEVFGAMASSFTLMPAGDGHGPDGVPGGDPFAPTAPGGAAGPGQNPLAPAAPDASPPAPTDDPFIGTFSGDGVSLTLRGSPGQYEGELSYGGQTFPVLAYASGDQLIGSFLTDGAEFDFIAVLSGATLDFETGGARFLLSR